jgi:hypothetical protein
MNKLSIENLKIADRAEIISAEDHEGVYVQVWRGGLWSYLGGKNDIYFPSTEKAMRTIRRYRKDIPVTSI